MDQRWITSPVKHDHCYRARPPAHHHPPSLVIARVIHLTARAPYFAARRRTPRRHHDTYPHGLLGPVPGPHRPLARGRPGAPRRASLQGRAAAAHPAHAHHRDGGDERLAPPRTSLGGGG